MPTTEMSPIRRLQLELQLKEMEMNYARNALLLAEREIEKKKLEESQVSLEKGIAELEKNIYG